MVQEAPSTETVESTPNATPSAPPEETGKPTPAEGEAPVPNEVATETAEETMEVSPDDTEPESLTFDPAQYEADDSPHRESFAQWKQEQKSQGWAEGRASAQQQVSESADRQRESDDLNQKALNAYGSVQGRLDEALQAGQVDKKALDNIFQDREFARGMEAMGQKSQERAREVGLFEGRVLGEIAQANMIIEMGAKELGRQSLAQEFLPQIEKVGQQIVARARNQVPVPGETQIDGATVMRDFIAKVKDIVYQQGLADKKTGTTEATRVAERKDQKPAQNVGTSAGATKDDRERKLDPLTPVSELIEIRNRENAG